MKSERELFLTAQDWRIVGETDLANFVLSKTKKELGELLESAQTSSADAGNEKLPRMEQVKIDSEKNCEKNCSGRWLSCASEALHRSNIHPYVFAAAIKNLLENG